MDAAGAERFAEQWAAEWSAKDVEAVVAHFAANARFVSPRAMETVGKPAVEGTDELRAYWQAAVGGISSLQFTVDRALWDPERRELAIVYTSDRDGVRMRACEFMRFDQGDRVVEGEAMYGAVL